MLDVIAMVVVSVVNDGFGMVRREGELRSGVLYLYTLYL